MAEASDLMTGLDVRTNSFAPVLVGRWSIAVVETYQIIHLPRTSETECRTMYHSIEISDSDSGDEVMSVRLSRDEAFELAELFLRVGRRMA